MNKAVIDLSVNVLTLHLYFLLVFKKLVVFRPK